MQSYVTTQRNKQQIPSISEIRVKQLCMLNHVVSVCEENKLEYFLEGGTLAGSLVNNGFGKYDDDIDISMPRADFEAFIEIYHQHLPEDYYLDYFTTTQNYSLVFAKIKDASMYYPEKNRPDNEIGHVFIDIFPLDEMERKAGITTNLIIFMNNVIKNMIFIRNSSKELSILEMIYRQFLKIIPTTYLFSIYYLLFTRRNTEYCINHGGRKGRQKNQVIEKKSYSPAKQHAFMGAVYSIPCIPEDIIGTYGERYLDRYRAKNVYSHLKKDNELIKR
ncbi:LicD family protein [Listeria weihenstephanensis]|uniref:LicD family protein n=1 Tax=Listeria weihenstephanensis TaxID=1006155 RepID=A0A841Z4U7_9LIST|nr:LicD family protein [Listeria weihenstephanensis]MBC1500228.1 LicD family protein [Listeria weihenstephanensis]